MDKLKKKESRSEYLKRWRKENPDYFKKYYKKNSKTICESAKRYRTSKKGKKKIQDYENTKKRKDQKKAYAKSLVEAKNILKKQKEKKKLGRK